MHVLFVTSLSLRFYIQSKTNLQLAVLVPKRSRDIISPWGGIWRVTDRVRMKRFVVIRWPLKGYPSISERTDSGAAGWSWWGAELRGYRTISVRRDHQGRAIVGTAATTAIYTLETNGDCGASESWVNVAKRAETFGGDSAGLARLEPPLTNDRRFYWSRLKERVQ